MRYLLAVLGTHGDVLPFLAVGRALAARGHEVALCAPEPFRPHAHKAGLGFHPMGTQAAYDRALANPQLWHPWRGIASLFAVALSFARETYSWIEANLTGEPCCVVASPNALGARMAQERFGVPLVTLHVTPFLIESRVAAPRVPGVPGQGWMPSRLRHWLGRGADRVIIDPAARPGLNALRAELGLRPVGRLRYWWNSPTRMVLAFPGWYAAPQPDWPSQSVQVGFPLADRLGDRAELDADLAAFLEEGPPPLVFSYGSGMRQAARFFRVAVALCQRMGRRGVLISREDDQVPATLLEGVVHVRYAPLSLLLPRSAALIHHGGIGTVAQALAAGTAQLVVPVAFNHFDDGHRLSALRLGSVLGRRAFTPRRAARAIARMERDPAMIAARAAARARMAGEDGTQNACDAIERVAHGA